MKEITAEIDFNYCVQMSSQIAKKNSSNNKKKILKNHKKYDGN